MGLVVFRICRIRLLDIWNHRRFYRTSWKSTSDIILRTSMIVFSPVFKILWSLCMILSGRNSRTIPQNFNRGSTKGNFWTICDLLDRLNIFIFTLKVNRQLTENKYPWKSLLYLIGPLPHRTSDLALWLLRPRFFALSGNLFFEHPERTKSSLLFLFLLVQNMRILLYFFLVFN